MISALRRSATSGLEIHDLRCVLRVAGVLAVTMSVILSLVWGIGAARVAAETNPELVQVVPTNPRHDIFVSPLVEPHMQDIGSTSKHLSRINIAIRVLRAPEEPIVLALRVLSRLTGEIVRESTTVVWEPTKDFSPSTYPTSVLWRTFEFAPVGEVGEDGLIVSVLPLDEHAQHIGLGLSRPEELPDSNIRKGSLGEEAPWDLTFTGEGLMTRAEHIAHLVSTDPIGAIPGTLLGDGKYWPGQLGIGWLADRWSQRPSEWLVWFVTLGILVVQISRLASVPGTSPSRGLWLFTAYSGFAWVLVTLWVIFPLIWSDVPGIISGSMRFDRGPLPVLGAMAWVALGMRLFEISSNKVGPAPHGLKNRCNVVVETAMMVGFGLIGLAALVGLSTGDGTTGPVLGAGGVILGIGGAWHLLALALRPMQTGSPGH